MSKAVLALGILWGALGSTAFAERPARSVDVTLAPGLTSAPETGRMFVLVTDRRDIEPRLVTRNTSDYYLNDPKNSDYALFFAQDVERLRPGGTATLSGQEQGYPFADLSQLPPGEYSIQAVFHRYEQVTPAHGKTIWLPMDDWEGSQFHLSPGNFYSEVHRIKVERDKVLTVSLTLRNRIPAAGLPQDTKFLKFRKFRSELASRFWGRDMPVGVTVLLPKGYDEHPNARYPVVFHMGHFVGGYSPLRFPMREPPATESPAAELSERWRWEQWSAADTPRVIAVRLMHPTPFYDDSYFVNSANTGPWQDVLMQELLPYINREFRTIDAPWARVLTGRSTGGWISLYTQITQPDSFGGAWSYCPDPVDFRALAQTDVYSEKDYFTPPGYKWLVPERPYARTVAGKWAVSARQFAQLSSALGAKSRGGEWMDAYAAMFGPVGADGYPIPLIDWRSGAIDNEVAATWRDNGFDLRYFMEKNWRTLGPKVNDRLFFLCGDMDEFYCNNAMYLLQNFLETTSNPPFRGSFRFGRLRGHTDDGLGLDPWPYALLSEMAAHMKAHAPREFDHTQWSYR